MNNTSYEREICINAISSAYKKGYEEGYDHGNQLAPVDFYERGLNDAWECARKIGTEIKDGGIDIYTLKEIFGKEATTVSIFRDYSAKEAIAKINTYEDKQKDDGFTVRDLIESDLKDMASRYSLEEIDDVLNQMRRKGLQNE